MPLPCVRWGYNPRRQGLCSGRDSVWAFPVAPGLEAERTAAGLAQSGAAQALHPPLPALPLQKVTQAVGVIREHPRARARRGAGEGASLPSRALLRGLVGAGPETQPDLTSPGGSSTRPGVPRSAAVCWSFHGIPGPCRDAFLRLESAECVLSLPSGWGCPEGVALFPCQITSIRRQGHASTPNFWLRGGWDCIISILPEMGHEMLLLEQASRLPSLPPFFFF